MVGRYGDLRKFVGEGGEVAAHDEGIHRPTPWPSDDTRIPFALGNFMSRPRLTSASSPLAQFSTPVPCESLRGTDSGQQGTIAPPQVPQCPGADATRLNRGASRDRDLAVRPHLMKLPRVQ